MSRGIQYALATTAVALVAPSPAFAQGPVAVSEGPSSVRLGVSLLGLIVAIVLLLEALTVRRVALGGVIAEKMSYVVLAIICLAASAVAQWTQNFVDGVTLDQVQIASQILVIAAMGLLAAYFFSVRRALQGYLKAMTGTEALQRELSTDDPDGEEPRG